MLILLVGIFEADCIVGEFVGEGEEIEAEAALCLYLLFICPLFMMRGKSFHGDLGLDSAQ